MGIRKIFLVVTIVIFSLLLLLFLLISPIAKYVIEKNSEEWIGRKVKIESLWINIFAGSLHIEDFKMYENKSNKVFVSFADFYCKVNIFKAIAGEYVVTPITFTKPQLNIIQNGAKFNFDDLIQKLSDTTNTKQETLSEPVKYFIENLSVASGKINYSTTVPVTSISITELNISSTPITYTDSIYNIKSDFGLVSGGKIRTQLTVNANSLAYHLHLNTENYKLTFLKAYMQNYLKVKTFDAILNSDLLISGNFTQPQEVAAKGKFDINDFSIIDTTGEQLSSFVAFKMDIDSLNTKAGIYNFNNIEFNQPYLKFGIYDDGTNFDRVLVETTADSGAAAPVEEYANIFEMMAGYIRSISTEYLLNEYRVDHLNLKDGHIIFTDYTLEDKFQYDLDSLQIHSDNFDSRNERVKIALSSRLNQSGVMTGTLSISPDGYENMEIDYTIKDLLISDINPYSKYYVATPFLDGIIFFKNSTVILNNQLKSTNKLFIENIKAGGTKGAKGLYDLPVKLAVAILRDPNGNIDFEIPVEGDLNNPKFKIGKVIWQVFKNLIIKAATAPFNLIARAFGGKEEDYKEIRYDYLQRNATAEQVRILNNLAKLLREKPEVGIEFVQLNNKQAEVEQLALFTTKKQFLGFMQDSLTIEQSLQLAELSNKDSAFVIWVDNTLGKKAALTSIQEKCIKYIGNEQLIAEVDSIMERRNTSILGYFTGNGINAQRIKISNVKNENQAAKESIPRYLINLFHE